MCEDIQTLLNSALLVPISDKSSLFHGPS